MRIAAVRAIAVNVPMAAPYRFAFGSCGSFTTTLVEVEDSDGVVGLGETPHGDLAGVVEAMGLSLVGSRVDDLNGSEVRVLSSTGFFP